MIERAAPPRSRILLAFAAVYLIWGSTYLAIRIAIETIPVFVMPAIRFLLAGAVLYVWARRHDGPRPTWREWRNAGAIGAFLLVCGNGAVIWAEQRVPTGAAALLVATVPLWMVLLEWARRGGMRPTWTVGVGVLLGLVGLVLLVQPFQVVPGAPIDPTGAAVLFAGSLSWASGSILSRRITMPRSPLVATAAEMLVAGALFVVVALGTGEFRQLSVRSFSAHSVLAVAYLVIFGSLVGFTAYVWLLRVASPARVSTYAYVNPVVAVVIGWAFASEPLTARTLISAAVIVGAVVLITAGQHTPPRLDRRDRSHPPVGEETSRSVRASA